MPAPRRRAKTNGVLDVLRRRLNLEEVELYRSLAQQRGMTFTEADEVLSHLNPELFRRFSRTFLDLSRVIPVSEEDSTLTVVTDDPDARTDQLERLTPVKHRTTCSLVTPTDFRRIWSALDLTVKGSRFAAEQGGVSGLLLLPMARKTARICLVRTATNTSVPI